MKIINDRTKSSNENYLSNIENANKDNDEQWAKVFENINNLKELVHVLFDQKVEGQKKLNQIKKTFDCLGYEEDYLHKLEVLNNKISASQDLESLGFNTKG